MGRRRSASRVISRSGSDGSTGKPRRSRLPRAEWRRMADKKEDSLAEAGDRTGGVPAAAYAPPAHDHKIKPRSAATDRRFTCPPPRGAAPGRSTLALYPDRVGGGAARPPTSHTTVRAVRHTAVHARHARR